MKTIFNYVRFIFALRRFNRAMSATLAEMARLQEAFDRTGETQSIRRK